MQNKNYIEFSVPLFFDDKFIDRIIEINKKNTKSKITSVYGSFPANIENKSVFEQRRLKKSLKINTEEKFFQYIKKIQNAGINFIYLMSSPKSLIGIDFYESSREINSFIETLLRNGINTIEVTNAQIIDYLTINYPQLKLKVSTLQEYISIKQYKNLFKSFPNITCISPSWDMNKNFRFLRNTKTLLNKNIELVVNDGCLAGCPFRVHHNMALTFNNSDEELNKESGKTLSYKSLCSYIVNKNPWEFIALQNIIYPWQIETYAQKYGITKFKLVEINPNDNSIEKNNESLNFFESYIKGIEDYDIIKDLPLRKFNHYTNNLFENNDITIDEVKELLPDIKYFENHGDNCSNVCGTDCKYCYNLAEKLNKKFPLK